MLERLFTAVRRWRDHQRLIADLSKLSDRQLQDIGVGSYPLAPAFPHLTDVPQA